MDISSEVREHVLVANIGERIDGSNALDFQNALAALIDDSERDVILDFENLKYISSAGLRVILMTAKTVQRQGGRLMVCSLSESVREVFKNQRLRPDHSCRGLAGGCDRRHQVLKQNPEPW